MLAAVLAAAVAAACMVRLGQAYSTGPPIDVCFSMTPSHGFPAQSSDPPFAIDVGDSTYGRNSEIDVIIQSLDGDEFLGIMMQARRRHSWNASPVGTFENTPAGTGTTDCNKGGDTFVHTSNDPKKLLKVTWRGPDDTVGDVEFVATIVRSKDTFWTYIQSTVLTSSRLFDVIADWSIDSVTCKQPVDLLFILDASDIMLVQEEFHGRSWDQALEFLAEFLETWKYVGSSYANVAVITYGRRVRVDIKLDDFMDLDELLDAIRNKLVTAGGDVRLADALELAADQVFTGRGSDRGGAPNIAYVIMGEDPDDVDEVVDTALELQDKGVTLNVIGARLQVTRSTVTQMLKNPVSNRNYWLALGFESLDSMMRSLTLSAMDQMDCDTDNVIIHGYPSGSGPTGEAGEAGESGESGIPDGSVGDPGQPGTGASAEDCPLDVAILVDSSGSICGNDASATTCDNWEIIKDFVLKLVQYFLRNSDPHYRARVSIVRFSRLVYLEFGLLNYTEYTPDLRDVIRNLKYANSWTNTSAALDTARLSVFTPSGGDRPDHIARDIVVVVTDGQPKVPHAASHMTDEEYVQYTLKSAQALKDHNATIFCVGVNYTGATDFISENVLKGMSSPDQKINVNYWKTRDFDSLQGIIYDLARATCQHGNPNITTCTADIVFVIDYSASLGRGVYDKVKQYVSQLVATLNIGTTPTSSRVGLVHFSDNDRLGFQLDEYDTANAVSHAVLEVKYVGGRTNTGAALKYMRETMFTSGNGDREGVPNVAVVLTDGGSNTPDKVTVIREARDVKKEGTHVVVVGLGGWLDEYELNAIASYPSSTNVLLVPDLDQLSSIDENMRALICNGTNDCGDDNPCQNGGTCVDGYDLYWCECPAGTAGVNCERSCREPADIAFAIDLSGSVGSENAQKEVDFMADLIRGGLNLQDNYNRLALEDFADSANTRFYLDEYSSNRQVLDALDFYYAGGGTNTAGALDEMRTEIFVSGRGDRDNTQNVGIVLTDGRSNDAAATWDSAKQLRSSGTHLIAVGVGNNLRENELEGIASEPTTSNVLNVDDFEDLSSSRDALIDLICNNDDNCAENPCNNGGTCNDLRGGYTCSCRRGYTGTNCERACSGVIDLVFLIDTSRGIRRDRFKKVIDFASSITNSLEISSGTSRVAAVTFAEDANVEFQLDTYSTKQDVIAHLKTLRYERGKANTAAALRAMIDDVFDDGEVRDDAQKVCIIISNDKSSIDQELTLPYAIEAKNTGVHMISLGLGEDVRLLEMWGLGSRPQSRNVFHAPSWRDLDGLLDDVIAATCDDDDACDDDPCDDGDCEDRFRTYRCNCDSDSTGEQCQRKCSGQMDLVFVLDLSGSIGTAYDVISQFTQRVIYGLNMNFGRTRVGVVVFSDDAKVWVYLDDFTDKEAVLNSIAFGSTGGRTNTAGAIKITRNEVFKNRRGDRSGVDNRAVIITDAKSNDESGTEREAERARQDGVEIYVVALGDSPRMSEVNSMASDPNSDHVVSVRDVDDVEEAADGLLDKLCQ